MSSPAMTTGQPPSLRLSPDLVAGLVAVRHAWRLARVLVAGRRTALAVASAAAVVFAIDYGLHLLTRDHLTVAQRLVVVGPAAALVLWRIGQVWRGVLRPVGLLETALAVERADRSWGDRLASAVQFASNPPGAASPAFVAATIAAVNAAPPPTPARVLAPGRRRKAAAALAGVVLAVALVAIALHAQGLLEPWLRRCLLLQDTTYPHRTQLTIRCAPAGLAVVRGQVLTVTIDAAGAVPTALVIHLRGLGENDADHEITADADGIFRAQVNGITSACTVAASGGDMRTAPVPVTVVEPPRLTGVQLHIIRPDYTRLGPLDAGPEATALSLPAGSRIAWSATADRPVTARLAFDSAAIPVVVDASGRGLSAHIDLPLEVPLAAAAPRTLRLGLTDQAGIAQDDAWRIGIAIEPDRPPTIRLAQRDAGSQVSARARVVLVAEAEDDHGVAGIDLAWTVAENPMQTRRDIVAGRSVAKPKPGPVEVVLDLLSLGSATAGNAAQVGGNSAQIAGNAAQVGDSLTIRAIAIDTRPDTAQRTTSDPVTVQIVADDDLLALLGEAQRAQGEQLRQALLVFAEIANRLATAAEAARTPAGRVGARQGAADAAAQAATAGDQVRQVAGRTAAVHQRLVANRVGDAANAERLQIKVVDPLAAAVRGPLPALTTELDRSKDLPAGDLSAGCARLAAATRDLTTTLRTILSELAKVENAQQVERSLQSIIRRAEQVREMTKGTGK
ncbi:hypothetical protein LBMAG53_01680 [Planctomycetota bacterium]|nr:hypothetical protein LBMAG53_01680 [Planctomycetota bacterium]